MNYYLSTFAPGAGPIVQKIIKLLDPKNEVIKITDDSVFFRSDMLTKSIVQFPFSETLYSVVKLFDKNEDYTLGGMFGWALSDKDFISRLVRFSGRSGNTFRIVESRKNLDKTAFRHEVRSLEGKLQTEGCVIIDRGMADYDIRIVQKDDYGFIAIRLSDRPEQKNELDKNSINYSLAYLMLAFAEVKVNEIVCDPFCGGGIIPIVCEREFKCINVIASDIEIDTIITKLSAKLSKKYSIRIVRHGVHDLVNEISKVNVVVTDPPWGLSPVIADIAGFYARILSDLSEILVEGGRLVMLTSDDDRIIQAIEKNKRFAVIDKLCVEVSGRSAILWKLNNGVA